MRGLTFEIPNEYGQHLDNILSAINCQQYFWLTGGEEAYYIENGELGSPLFPRQEIWGGEAFLQRISNGMYYTIFADLKAFPTEAEVKDIMTYDEFLNSACELAFLLVDCSYVIIYAKDPQTTKRLHAHATSLNYTNIEFITDNLDARTTLKAF